MPAKCQYWSMLAKFVGGFRADHTCAREVFVAPGDRQRLVEMARDDAEFLGATRRCARMQGNIGVFQK